MKRALARLPLLLPLLLLGGCVSTAVAIVKAPFQLAGAAVDGLTTSQEEADRNRGRAARAAEEDAREDARDAARNARREAKRRAEEAEDDAARARRQARRDD